MSARKLKLSEIDIHPLAAIFPMMPDDELTELAEDIKANGLIHPIVLDADGKVVDGRNRLRACEIAGVEPRFEPLDGRDARDFITSVNLNRRNLSKSQQAMALAMMYPEPTPGKRSEARRVLESKRLSDTMFSQARAILRHSAELAQDVLYRGTHFDVALKEVREAEQKRRSHDLGMAELRSKVPDIAALIDDGRMTIEAGMSELRQRQQHVRMTIDQARTAVSQVQKLPGQLIIIEAADRLTDADLAMIDEDREEADPLAELTAKDIDALLAAARKLPEMLIPPPEEDEEAE